MTKRSRNYIEASKAIDSSKAYEPYEAVGLVKQMSGAAFDETVEIHLRTSSDPRQADQMVRGVAMLPNGLGKPIRVLVFANGEAADIAKSAGADYVGDDELINHIEKGWVDFDVSLATPNMMSKIGRLGRVLGRRGLMPNPRTGTLVQQEDLPRAIEEAKQGRVEYRMDRTALIHAPLGKVSFSEAHLMENIASLMDAVIKSKPSGVKGAFIRTAHLTSTMGPSVRVDVNALSAIKIE